MRPQPMICVDDVAQSSAWFQKVLGFASTHGGPDYEQLTSDGDLVLQLHAWDVDEHPHMGNPKGHPRGNGAILWFESASIEADFQRAKAAGAEILEPLHVNPLAHHLEFWVREPNGYVLVVASPYGDLGAFGHGTS